MPYISFISIAAIAVIITVVFMFRGLKVIRWELSRYIILLPYLWMLLVLFPGAISRVVIQATGIVIISLIAAIVLIDVVLSNFFKIKSSFGPGSEKASQYLVEICDAVGFLTNRKTGGLIVIERGDSLRELIGGGIPFDAQVKSEIIASLFEKGSSVHDGAMIIKDARIYLVKAILPVHMDDVSSIKFGTRHRAALGITQNTDAIAIAISEERAEVSVANKGFLSKVVSKQELLDYLMRTLKRKK